MRAHVRILLNLLNELLEKLRCDVFAEHLTVFSQRVSYIQYLSSTNASFFLSYDSKLAFNSRFVHTNIKMTPLENVTFYGRQCIML